LYPPRQDVGTASGEAVAVGVTVGEGMNVCVEGAGEDTAPHPTLMSVNIRRAAARVERAKAPGIKRYLSFCS
jgi:hypothetical protein